MMDHDEHRIQEFLASLPPIDETKRPPGWPSARHRIGLIFPPDARPGEPSVEIISASIRLSNLQALFVRRAALAAGITPARWAGRHLLAAAGYQQALAPTAAEILERIYTGHVHLDSLLSSVRKQ